MNRILDTFINTNTAFGILSIHICLDPWSQQWGVMTQDLGVTMLFLSDRPEFLQWFI